MRHTIVTALILSMGILSGVGRIAAEPGTPDSITFPWGKILYAPGQEKLAESSAEQIESTIRNIRQTLDFDLEQQFTVVIANSREEYLKYAGRQIPDWSAGVTSYTHGRIVMKSPSLGKSTVWDYDETLRHEVAHVLIGQNVDPRRLPRWLNEGLAMIVAGQNSIGQMYTLAQYVVRDKLLSLSEIEQMLHFSQEKASLGYAESHSAVKFILSEFPDGTLTQVLGKMRNSDLSWQQSFSEVTGLSQYYFEQHWRSHLKENYKWLTVLSSETWIFILFPVLALLAYLAVKWRNHRKMREWEEEEERWERNSDWDFEYLPDEDDKWRGDIH